MNSIANISEQLSRITIENK